MISKFHIAKTPHQYGGMRWSIYERNGNIVLQEICRCPSMADASMVCDALNNAVRDRTLWSVMLETAASAHTRHIGNQNDTRTQSKNRRNGSRGNGANMAVRTNRLSLLSR